MEIKVGTNEAFTRGYEDYKIGLNNLWAFTKNKKEFESYLAGRNAAINGN